MRAHVAVATLATIVGIAVSQAAVGGQAVSTSAPAVAPGASVEPDRVRLRLDASLRAPPVPGLGVSSPMPSGCPVLDLDGSLDCLRSGTQHDPTGRWAAARPGAAEHRPGPRPVPDRPSVVERHAPPGARPVDRSGDSLSDRTAATGPGVGSHAVLPSASVAVLGFVWLYRRLEKRELLDNDLRSRIAEIVRARPGVNASELASRLDVALNTVLYHAKIMEEYDLLLTRRVGGQVAFFDERVHDEVERRVHAQLRGTKRRLVELVRSRPGIGISEAARCLDRDRSTIKHHVDRLVDHGILTSRRAGRRCELHVTPSALDAMTVRS